MVVRQAGYLAREYQRKVVGQHVPENGIAGRANEAACLPAIPSVPRIKRAIQNAPKAALVVVGQHISLRRRDLPVSAILIQKVFLFESCSGFSLEISHSLSDSILCEVNRDPVPFCLRAFADRHKDFFRAHSAEIFGFIRKRFRDEKEIWRCWVEGPPFRLGYIASLKSRVFAVSVAPKVSVKPGAFRMLWALRQQSDRNALLDVEDVLVFSPSRNLLFLSSVPVKVQEVGRRKDST